LCVLKIEILNAQGDVDILTKPFLLPSSLATLSFWRGAGGEAGLSGLFISPLHIHAQSATKSMNIRYLAQHIKAFSTTIIGILAYYLISTLLFT